MQELNKSASRLSGLSVALGTLRQNVDARLETRSKLAGLFASQIGKDIMELMLDVNKLRDEVAVMNFAVFWFSCRPYRYSYRLIRFLGYKYCVRFAPRVTDSSGSLQMKNILILLCRLRCRQIGTTSRDLLPVSYSSGQTLDALKILCYYF